MPVEWVTFDCYGTLIDWERGITDALLPFVPAGTDRGALAEWYIEMEAQFEAEGYHLYRDVLDRVGRRVLHSLDAALPDDKASPLPASLADWRPFPEVPAALRALVAQGRYLAILSNVDRDLLELSIGRLGIRPDLAITAEDSRSYKPAPGHWRQFLARSGSSTDRTVHVGASQYHDMRPAAALGFRTVFIDRHGETLDMQGQGPRGQGPPDAERSAERPTRVLHDLSTLPDVIDRLAAS